MSGRLVHLNGAPGVGKSTLARALVAARPGWLNCDIDVLRSLVGGWEGDFAGTGSVVRPLALAMISAHLAEGRSVVLPQMLADPDELDRFAAAATAVGAAYTGVLLEVPDHELAARWRERDTTAPTTAASNRVIAADGGDAAVLDWARRLREGFSTRPGVTTIGIGGLDVPEAVGLLAGALRPEADASSRAVQVLALLDADLRSLGRTFEVDIVEARAVGPETVEVVYRHPWYDGLLGLRRDVGEQEVDLDPDDPYHELAVNESSPREMATMLRVELEEPLGSTRPTPDAAGIRWWGHPAPGGPP